jgi:hypothetical protein
MVAAIGRVWASTCSSISRRFLARGFNTGADHVRRLAAIQSWELLHRLVLHIKVNVDAVEDGAGDALLVLRDHRHCAGALLFDMAIVAARTGILTI